MITDEKTLYFVKERLYDRRNELLADIEDNSRENNSGPFPEWYNTHDYSSGYWAAMIGNMKDELEFIENLINNIENATI